MQWERFVWLEVLAVDLPTTVGTAHRCPLMGSFFVSHPFWQPLTHFLYPHEPTDLQAPQTVLRYGQVITPTEDGIR